MLEKTQLRKKFILVRKKNYFDIKPSFFAPLINFIRKKYKKKNINISNYYPSSYEVNVLKILEKKNENLKILLPVLQGKKMMSFHKWNENDLLKINKFGMLEPVYRSKFIVPDIMLIPLLAYDKNKNRLGYGGGFYDRYLNKYLNNRKDILRVGIAFSFQKYKKIPTSSTDVKLNFILNEKGIF